LLLIAFAGLISLVYLYLSGPRYGRLIGIDNATSTFTNLTAARVLICTTRKENILSDENSIDHVVVSLSGKVLRELPALEDIQHNMQPFEGVKDDGDSGNFDDASYFFNECTARMNSAMISDCEYGSLIWVNLSELLT
jgi:hypothetical protein